MHFITVLHFVCCVTSCFK